MDAIEYLDICDKDGNIEGKMLRSEVHKRGLWHRAVHIWLINERGELLIQRRSKEKENHPDMWDIPAAGHIPAGEKPLDAAIREIGEELGIDVTSSDLELIGTINQSSTSNGGAYVNNEINDVYLVHTNKEVDEMTLQVGEVSEIKYIKPIDLKDKFENEDPEFVYHDKEYPLLFNYLKI